MTGAGGIISLARHRRHTMRRRDVENDNGNRLIYYEFNDKNESDASDQQDRGDDV